MNPDDTDTNSLVAHHTLGMSGVQAASGNHNHDGTNSLQILNGVTISGVRGTAACDVSIIAALVALGATDITT